jgi:hypothetical protein
VTLSLVEEGRVGGPTFNPLVERSVGYATRHRDGDQRLITMASTCLTTSGPLARHHW